MQHELCIARVDIRKVQVDAGAHRRGYIGVHQIFTYVYIVLYTYLYDWVSEYLYKQGHIYTYIHIHIQHICIMQNNIIVYIIYKHAHIHIHTFVPLRLAIIQRYHKSPYVVQDLLRSEAYLAYTGVYYT